MLSHQEKLAFIRGKCIEANPEIVELTSGCRLLWDCGKGKVIGAEFYVKNYAGNLLVRPEGGIATTTIKERQVQKIIGRPIRLADVLLLSEFHREALAVDYAGYFREMPDGDIPFGAPKWNLRKDDLNDQEPATIDFIYDLLK